MFHDPLNERIRKLEKTIQELAHSRAIERRKVRKLEDRVEFAYLLVCASGVAVLAMAVLFVWSLM